MKNLLVIGLIFLFLIGLYGFAVWYSKRKEKEVFAKPTNIQELAKTAKGSTSTSVLSSHDTEAPKATLTPSFSIPEVTKSAAAQTVAMAEAGAKSETLDAAKRAVIAKTKADVLGELGIRGEEWEQAITDFHYAKQDAAVQLAVETGLTYYGALHELGYPIPQSLRTVRSSIDKEIEATRQRQAVSGNGSQPTQVVDSKMYDVRYM